MTTKELTDANPTPQVLEAIPAIQALTFVRPLAGLPGLTEFTLVPFDKSGALFTLISSTPDGPQFFVATPTVFFPTYLPDLPSEVTGELGLADASAEGQVFVVLTLGNDLSEHTANLSAPIVVNPVTRAAVQVVLDDEQHSVRTPIAVA